MRIEDGDPRSSILDPQGEKYADTKVFQLNMEAHPESSNVYDGLGEAYMLNGDKALAVENYEKSLKLNPNNANAMEKPKLLRAQ